MKKSTRTMLAMTLAATLLMVGCNSAANVNSNPASSSATPTTTPVSSAAQPQKMAEPEFKLIAAHVCAEQHSFHLGMEAFRKEVEEKSNGRIAVEIHPNGELGGNEDELVQKMATGTVDMIIAAPSFMAQSVKEVDLLSLPYLFSDISHWEKVVDGEPGQEMSKLVEEKSGSLKVLGYFKDGVRNMYAIKPIKTIADMKDLKFRIQNSPTQIAFWSALGTQPTFVAFNEIYQALQNGVIDGAENSFASIAQQKHYEVCKYIMLTEHDVATRFLLISDQKYNSMPPDLKAIIDVAGKNASKAQRAVDLTLSDQYAKEMVNAGIEMIPIDKQPLIEMTEQIRVDAAKRLGLSEMLDQINALK